MEPQDLCLRQLRSELKRRNLRPSGLKEALVFRLKDALQKEGKETVPLANIKKKPKDPSTGKRFVSIKEKYRRKHFRPTNPPFFSAIQQSDNISIDDATSSENMVPVNTLKEEDRLITQNINLKDLEDLSEEESDSQDSVISSQREPLASEKRKFMSPFEMEERNMVKKKKTDRGEDNPSKYSNRTSNEFFEQAYLELQRIKMQRRHDQELLQLELQIEALKKSISDRDRIIDKLQQSITEKDRAVRALHAATVPQDLADNWTVYETLMALGST